MQDHLHSVTEAAATAACIKTSAGDRWGRIGFVLSAGVIAAAAVALWHMVRGLDGAEVIAAVGRRDVKGAALFVVLAYLTLTFYDLFALRALGRREVPWRTAAFAAFTSYAVGHNLGASAFTGGAVRWRIYSARGLTAVEVAKLCVIAGLTFWLGNATVLGVGVAFAPQAASALDLLPAPANRALAAALLAAVAAYVGWVWRSPRTLAWRGLDLTLPGGPMTLVQVGIGILDLSCCAAAMYMLAPAQPDVGFVTVAVIFVSSTLLGFASHSPAGLGVFDVAMLSGLWQFQREDLVAGLLLFRLLYYVVPFALAVVVLGGREIALAVSALDARRRGTVRQQSALSSSRHGPVDQSARGSA